MRQIVTQAIVLARTNYGEADRIVTLLTPDQGKLRVLAKGVRRIKSKLAGGIELFSVSTITFVRGRGELGTLVSARLEQHFGRIVQDLERTMLGYELIKQLHKNTEDEPESEYFALLEQAFDALNDSTIPTQLVQLWFSAQLLRLAGHTPNLQTDTQGQKLVPGKHYTFSFEKMCFDSSGTRFTTDHIKFLRLTFEGRSPKVLASVHGADHLVFDLRPIIATLVQQLI